MTAYDYSISVATATRLIERYGQSITLRHLTIGTYDPATGENTSTSTDRTVTGALFDFGSGQTTVRGTLIQGGDKRLLMPANAAPVLQDRIIVGTVEYTVISIGEINPGGTSVMFDCHIRT